MVHENYTDEQYYEAFRAAGMAATPQNVGLYRKYDKKPPVVTRITEERTQMDYDTLMEQGHTGIMPTRAYYEGTRPQMQNAYAEGNYDVQQEVEDMEMPSGSEGVHSFVQDLNKAPSREEQMKLMAQQIQKLQLQVEQMGGYPHDVQRQQPLILEHDTVIRARIKKEIEEWKKANPRWKVLSKLPVAGKLWLQQNLYNHLIDKGFHIKAAEEIGAEPWEISNEVANMFAAGASAVTMLLSKGNFPLGAAAYFGVRAVTGQTRDSNELFGGVDSEGGTYDGVPVTPMEVEIPEGLPNEIFAEYRFINYDRLSGRWYPSDEIRPLAFDSNEDFRWFCLDRVSGKVYKANLIKKPRIYLQ